MENNKRITKNGALTIPAHIRRDLGIAGGERVKLEVQVDGTINLKRIAGSCVFCKADDGQLHKYMGRFVCCCCAESLGGL